MIESEVPTEIKRLLLEVENEPLRDRLVAIWAVHYGFTDLFKMAIPQPPQELLAWKARSPDYQKGNPFNWKNEKVVAWMDAKGKAENTNKSNVLWVTQLKKWLDKDKDPEEIIAASNKLYHLTAKDRTLEVKAVQREWT